MENITAHAEAIPLPDAACDAVFAFNSLDHVDDLTQTVREIKRVVRPGGLFLLIVESNHPPSMAEPHTIIPTQVAPLLAPEFECDSLSVYRKIGRDVHGSVLAAEELPLESSKRGVVKAKFMCKVNPV